MTDTVQVLQFPHPGGEHNAKPYVDAVMPWNVGEHKRKFLAREGSYLTSLDATPKRADLGFWGEWEPPTAVSLLRSRREGNFPRYLHRPVEVPAVDGWRQNTDPCVLGGFWYTNCRQLNTDHRTPHRRTQSLAPGSVILFGSRRGHVWVLDTVFVVAAHEEFDYDDRPDVPDHINAAVIEPLYSKGERYPAFRAYRGATHDAPVDGRFSFVPCSPLTKQPLGFERPEVDLELGLNPNLAMAVRALDADGVDHIWRTVVEDVLAAKLYLGVELDAPTWSTAQQPARRRTGRSQEAGSGQGRARPC